jgi:hypothetical protein
MIVACGNSGSIVEVGHRRCRGVWQRVNEALTEFAKRIRSPTADLPVNANRACVGVANCDAYRIRQIGYR